MVLDAEFLVDTRNKVRKDHLKRNASIIERTISFCPHVNPSRQQFCETASRFCLLNGEPREHGQLYGAALFRLCARVHRLRNQTGTHKSKDPVLERLKSAVRVGPRFVVVPYPTLQDDVDDDLDDLALEDDPSGLGRLGRMGLRKQTGTHAQTGS